MSQHLRVPSAFVATILLALISGFFYAYEVSVMRGFATLPDRDFIRAMQAVNATVRNIPFGLSFFGAAVASVVAALLHLPVWRSPAAICAAGAAMLYVGGGMLLTMTINVPMNEWLASVGSADTVADPATIRVRYEAPWVYWNLIRTLCSIAALGLMVFALWFGAVGHRKNQ